VECEVLHIIYVNIFCTFWFDDCNERNPATRHLKFVAYVG